ncbi:MAG TPA: addiction module protein [Ramlibacter sp.]|nr:addiction module protein [Ramlibacter sp.]
MPDTVTELAAKGAALAPEDRSRLIDLLLVSLHEGPLAEVEAAWDEEVERRLSAHDRGETQSIDGAEVLAEARRIAR